MHFTDVLEMELLVTDGLHIGGHIHPGPERCVVEITGPALILDLCIWAVAFLA